MATPADLTVRFSTWETAELEAAWKLSAKGLGTGRKGRATPGGPSSLRMLQPVVLLILGYHGQLARAWERMAVRLEAVAQDDVANSAVGHALVENRLQAAITPAVTTFLEAAAVVAPKAWAIGQDAAVKWTGVALVPPEAVTDRLRQWQRANAAYVVDRLFATVYDGMREILVDPTLPVKSGFVRTWLDRLGGKAPHKTPSMLAYEAAQELADKQAKQLAGNANSLWGLAHEAFASEIELETAFVTNWITTSDDPCADCRQLEDDGPYGPGNPLPTVPGAGATRCRTNCMCILEAEDAATGLSGSSGSAAQWKELGLLTQQSKAMAESGFAPEDWEGLSKKERLAALLEVLDSLRAQNKEGAAKAIENLITKLGGTFAPWSPVGGPVLKSSQPPVPPPTPASTVAAPVAELSDREQQAEIAAWVDETLGRNKRWWRSLTKTEKVAQKHWIEKTYSVLRDLDAGRWPEDEPGPNDERATYQQSLDELYTGVSKAPPLKPGVRLYRGFKNVVEPDRLAALTTVGNTVELEAITSFSVSQRRAQGFTRGGSQGDVMWSVVDQGTARPIYRDLEGEREVLVPASTQYRVVSARQAANGSWEVQLEEVARGAFDPSGVAAARATRAQTHPEAQVEPHAYTKRLMGADWVWTWNPQTEDWDKQQLTATAQAAFPAGHVVSAPGWEGNKPTAPPPGVTLLTKQLVWVWDLPHGPGATKRWIQQMLTPAEQAAVPAGFLATGPTAPGAPPAAAVRPTWVWDPADSSWHLRGLTADQIAQILPEHLASPDDPPEFVFVWKPGLQLWVGEELTSPQRAALPPGWVATGAKPTAPPPTAQKGPP